MTFANQMDHDCCVCLTPYEDVRGERKCDTCENYCCHFCVFRLSSFVTGRTIDRTFTLRGTCFKRKELRCYMLSYTCPTCRSHNKYNLKHAGGFLRRFIDSVGSDHYTFTNEVEGGITLTCELMKPYDDLLYSIN